MTNTERLYAYVPETAVAGRRRQIADDIAAVSGETKANEREMWNVAARFEDATTKAAAGWEFEIVVDAALRDALVARLKAIPGAVIVRLDARNGLEDTVLEHTLDKQAEGERHRDTDTQAELKRALNVQRVQAGLSAVEE